MGSKISPLIICVFLLITIFNLIPRCLSARNLLDYPQTNDDGNDMSRTGVHGSNPSHAGSAAGDRVPPGGVVNNYNPLPPPPPPIRRNTTGDDQSVSATNTNCNGNSQVATYYDAYGNQIVKTTSCSSEQVITSTDANGNQHVVVSRNGQTIDTTNGGVQQTYNQYSPPEYYNENDVVTPPMSP